MSGTVTRLPGVGVADRRPSAHVAGLPVPSPRVRLSPWVRMEVEAARQCVMELDEHSAGADLPRMAYLLGVLEGHARTLLDVLDTVTEPGQ